MQKEQIRQLITGYMNGELSAARQQELLQYSGSQELMEEVLGEMMAAEAAHPVAVSPEEALASLRKVLAVDKPQERKGRVRHLILRRIAVAASLVLIAGMAWYFWPAGDNQPAQPRGNYAAAPVNDAAPGRAGAVLTLADGRQILLDSLGNGIVTTQGKTTVLIRDGQLVYDAAAAGDGLYYNTMTTPRGRQYRLRLPDGTLVWLNAASSIRYPAAFAGNAREVFVTGEAYFEVAKDKTRPFRVRVNDQGQVEVLGTHFNINAYGDEGDIRTTLLEGSVRVSHNGEQAMISPGQQAVAGKEIRVADHADLAQVMAWKNGYFNFNNTDIKLVLKQLERWYDVEVEFEGNLKPKLIYGKMQRDLYLSQMLEILNKLGVKYQVEGKRLTIIS